MPLTTKRTSSDKFNIDTFGFEEKLRDAPDKLFTMAVMRDALLPRIMSGEASVNKKSKEAR
jgi:hypothetical protein